MNGKALRTAGIVAGCVAIVVFFGLVFALQWQVWQECRETNTWLYCMRVLSR